MARCHGPRLRPVSKTIVSATWRSPSVPRQPRPGYEETARTYEVQRSADNRAARDNPFDYAHAGRQYNDKEKNGGPPPPLPCLRVPNHLPGVRRYGPRSLFGSRAPADQGAIATVPKTIL